MTSGLGWAKNPMLNRIHELRKDKPITLLYGSRSWIDQSSWDLVKNARDSSYVNTQVIQGAGHHIFAGNSTHNTIIYLNFSTIALNWSLQISLRLLINMWMMPVDYLIVYRIIISVSLLAPKFGLAHVRNVIIVNFLQPKKLKPIVK